MSRIDPSKLTLTEKVVQINRVAKVVKGGRRFTFSALVVVGDGQGHVGVGVGKAGEVPESIRKGTEDAKKHLIKVPFLGTITAAGIHDILSKVYGSSNPVNATRAAIEALSQLRTAAQISAARGKRVRIRVGGQQETKEVHNG